MHHLLTVFTIWMLSGVVVFGFCGTIIAVPPVATLLPSETTLYVATEDLRQCRDQWKKTGLASIVNLPEMSSFVEGAKQYFQGPKPKKMPRWGLTWDDVTQLTVGEVCVAAMPGKGQRPAIMLLLDTTGRGDAVRQVLQRIDKNYRDAQMKRRIEKITDKKIFIYQQASPEGGSSVVQERAYFFEQGLLGMSTDVDRIKDLFNFWSGQRSDSLAQRASFYELKRQWHTSTLEATPHLTWFVDPLASEQLFRKESAAGGVRESHLHGFDVFQAVGGYIAFAVDNYQLFHETVAYAPKSLRKTARLLSFHNQGGFDLPSWVPDSLSRLAVLHLNSMEALKGYGSWFEAEYADAEEGVFEDVLREIQDDPESPGVDVRGDLLGHLAGPIYMLSGLTVAGVPPREDVLVAMATTQEDEVAEAIEKLLLGDPDVVKRVEGSHTFWVFRQMRSSEGTNLSPLLGPDLSGIAISVAQGYLWCATNVTLLETILTPSAKRRSLALQDKYQWVVNAFERLGAETTVWYQFVRLKEDLAFPYTRLRDGKIGEADSLRGRLAKALLEYVDRLNQTLGGTQEMGPLPFKKLPPYDLVREHLDLSASFAKRHDSGWSITGFLASPP